MQAYNYTSSLLLLYRFDPSLGIHSLSISVGHSSSIEFSPVWMWASSSKGRVAAQKLSGDVLKAECPSLGATAHTQRMQVTWGVEKRQHATIAVRCGQG
eukprot:1634919-Amphidinium_carterae.2